MVSAEEEQTLNADRDDLEKVVKMVSRTREEEIGCDECFEQLDRFVEMQLSGLNPAEAMPLVKDHLDKCGDCREEFEALIEALQTEIDSPGPVSHLWSRLRRSFGPN
jgi:hypothetical protein